MKRLDKYSIGLGDRFGHQGKAQLKAITEASAKGLTIAPVWNKSNREHQIIGTDPEDVRHEADTVTRNEGFKKPYYVDADHINLDTVNRFIGSSDFFTIDVASYIGTKSEESELEKFLSGVGKYLGDIKIPGDVTSLSTTKEQVRKIAETYLYATNKAGAIYRRIAEKKGEGNFVTEVSMDEVAAPQTPIEIFFILKMLADEKIPLQTIAPKFSGRFNKGVDYVGDPKQFAKEFESDLLVTDLAVREFGLPENLKISIHSGSDKFSIYPYIGTLIKKHAKGIHLKTAGTTWLEEIIGLTLSGKEGLEFAREIYCEALEKIDELCAPYADVIDINLFTLPAVSEVMEWDGGRFSAALRHIPGNTGYNPDMRQLIHVAYKLAANRIDDYYRLLENNEEIISQCVFENIYKRHINRLFSVE